MGLGGGSPPEAAAPRGTAEENIILVLPNGQLRPKIDDVGARFDRGTTENRRCRGGTRGFSTGVLSGNAVKKRNGIEYVLPLEC